MWSGNDDTDKPRLRFTRLDGWIYAESITHGVQRRTCGRGKDLRAALANLCKYLRDTKRTLRSL